MDQMEWTVISYIENSQCFLKALYQFLLKRTFHCDSSQWKKASAPSQLSIGRKQIEKSSQLKTQTTSCRKGKTLQSVEPRVQRTEPKVQRTQTRTKEVKRWGSPSKEQNWTLVKRNPVRLELRELSTCAWLDCSVSLDQCVPLVPPPFIWKCLSTTTVLALPLHCILLHCILGM